MFKISDIRIPRARAVIAFGVMILIMASCECVYANPDQTMGSGEAGALKDKLACECSGPDLTCGSTTIANAWTCNQQKLDEVGLCSCDGSTLTCEFYLCSWQNVNGPSVNDVYLPCDANNMGGFSAQGARVSNTPLYTRIFENSPRCEVSATATSTAADTATATGTSTATSTPTDTPTATATNTPIPEATVEPTEEPTEETLCGNGVCDPGESVYTCTADCGEPPEKPGPNPNKTPKP